MKTTTYIFFATIFVSVLLARASYTGYTKKTGTTGCSCHGSSPNSNIVVEITGPAQLTVGATATYQVTISGGSGSKVSVDIAASDNKLQSFDSALKLSSNELITNGTKSYSGGKYTYSFNYTAPTAIGQQTLYATGLSSTSSGWNFAPNKTIEIISATGIESEQNSVPREFTLSQNFPNPFNPSTEINFTVPIRQYMIGQVLDIQGQVVSELVNGNLEAGNHQVIWNAQNVSAGIYFFRMQANQATKTIKLIYLK